MNRNEKRYTSTTKWGICVWSNTRWLINKLSTYSIISTTWTWIYMCHVPTNVYIIFNKGLMDRLNMIIVISWPSSMTQKLCIFLWLTTLLKLVYKNLHVVFRWWKSLIFIFIYKRVFSARRFYINKKQKYQSFLRQEYIIFKSQIPRALLSNIYRIFHSWKKLIIK